MRYAYDSVRRWSRLESRPVMNRKEFLAASIKAGVGCCALRVLAAHTTSASAADAPSAVNPEKLRQDKSFTAERERKSALGAERRVMT